MKSFNYVLFGYWALVCLAFAIAVGADHVRAVDGRKVIATTPCVITEASCPKCMMYAANPPIAMARLADTMPFWVQNSAGGGDKMKNGFLNMPCYKWAECRTVPGTEYMEKSCTSTGCAFVMEPTSCVELRQDDWTTEYYPYELWPDAKED